MNRITATPRNLGIFSRTNRSKAEVFLTVKSDRPGHFNLRQANNAVVWARNSGRLTGTEELTIRSLSGYKYAKLVCSLQGLTTQDALTELKVKLA